MKIVVAHPGKQHAMQLAYALQKSGDLNKFITTVYDKKGSVTTSVISLLQGKDKKKGKSRKDRRLLDSNVMQYCEVLALLQLLLARTKCPKVLIEKLDAFIKYYFGIKVAKYAVKIGADAVIMFDTTSVSCFKYLEKKAPQIKRILDASIANRVVNKRIYEKEYELYGDKAVINEQKYLWNKHEYNKILEEVKHIQYVLAASNFVIDSYKYVGVPESRIFHVPYGVDTSMFTSNTKLKTEKVKLVFVGSTIRRKGLHHLLSVVAEMKSDCLHLDVVGDISHNSDLYIKYSKYDQIDFHGFVTRDKIAEIYHNANVFVLPSLSEGLALVGLEAMGSGLPIICSTNSGVNDLVLQYQNGIVINPLDENELRDAIKYCINHKSELSGWGELARSTAERYTWEAYYSKISDTMNRIMKL